jgi:6-phosphogluconolactonase
MSTDVTVPSGPEVIRTTNFVADAARFILDHARKAILEHGLFRLALSGGNTPRLVHAELAKIAGDLPWNKVQITFGDERCVPPDHPDSNYRMAKESLLDPAGIPESNVFRIRGEIDPELAANECEAKLSAVAARFSESRYVHDLILLGLGEDGHTASLFPDSPALDETHRNVIPATGPKPPPQRVTFTFPLLNAARCVCFLVQQTPSKKQVIDEAIAGDRKHPAARVSPENGQLTWLIGE